MERTRLRRATIKTIIITFAGPTARAPLECGALTRPFARPLTCARSGMSFDWIARAHDRQVAPNTHTHKHTSEQMCTARALIDASRAERESIRCVRFCFCFCLCLRLCLCLRSRSRLRLRFFLATACVHARAPRRGPLRPAGTPHSLARCPTLAHTMPLETSGWPANKLVVVTQIANSLSLSLSRARVQLFVSHCRRQRRRRCSLPAGRQHSSCPC